MAMLADAGVPMIFIQWPLMAVALVPVIFIEAWVIRRWVPVPSRERLIGMGKANVFSTLVGVPLGWLAMLALEFAVLLPASLAAERWKWTFEGPVWQILSFLLSSAWLGPADEYLHWMVPVAVSLLLVPCFWLSVLLERRSCLQTWSAADPARVRRGVLVANVASYLLLLALACGWAGFELATKGPHVKRIRVEQPAAVGAAFSSVRSGLCIARRRDHPELRQARHGEARARSSPAGIVPPLRGSERMGRSALAINMPPRRGCGQGRTIADRSPVYRRRSEVCRSRPLRSMPVSLPPCDRPPRAEARPGFPV